MCVDFEYLSCRVFEIESVLCRTFHILCGGVIAIVQAHDPPDNEGEAKLKCSALMLAAVIWSNFLWPVSQLEPTQIGLSRNYCGTFQWHGSTLIQRVSISLSSVSAEADGNIFAVGTGRYITAEQITQIDVRWLIDPRSMRFEMWESNPRQGNFVTDGSHIGTVSPRYRSIEAVWTTRTSGLQGTLSLGTECAMVIGSTRPVIEHAKDSGFPIEPARL